jgi:hypothetical protein
VFSGAFLRDVKPLGLDIRWSVDHLGTCVTDFYMEHIVFTKTYLSYIRVIMAFVHVPLVVLLIQTVMGQIPALEFMVSGARGLLQPCPILPGHKGYCLPRS